MTFLSLASRHASGARLTLRRLQPSESRELREWIIARHYLHSAPPGYRVALEVLLDGHRVGGVLLGRPTSRELDAETWLEVTRMYLVDETPANAESWTLGRMRRWVRCWMPEIRGLLSYSDPAAGHDGGIYRADGWAAFGRTKAQRVGWRNRPGRKGDGDNGYASKVRWVRTP